MAKELPYFKFNSTEWMTGQIVFEPLELQGLFINICALYWKNLGVLEISQIEQRYKKKRLIDKLSGRFFSVSSGFISIAFLDEQLHERDALSGKNKTNGEKGGRPKKTQNNPPLSENNPTVTQPKPKKSNIEVEREVEIETETASPLVVAESLELLVQEFNKVKKSEYKATDTLKPKWLAIKKQGYTIENVLTALKNAMESDFHKQNNHKHLSVEFFTRTDKLDMWLNAKPKTQQPHTSAGYLQNITGII